MREEVHSTAFWCRFFLESYMVVSLDLWHVFCASGPNALTLATQWLSGMLVLILGPAAVNSS